MFPAIDRRPARCRSSRRCSIPRGSIAGGPVQRALAGSQRPGAAGFPLRRVRAAVRRRGARAGRALFALCGAAAILIGCPLYSDECDSRNDCASGFYCGEFSRQCEPVLDAIACTRPGQCEVGETCTPDFVCRPGSCDYHGCVRGYRCGVVDFAHTCVPAVDEDASAAPTDAGSPDAGVDLDAGSSDAGSGDTGSTDAGP